MASAELPEYRCVELSAIVTNQNSRYAKPAEDVPYHEGLHLLLGNGGQGLGLGPLGEVVHDDDGEPDLAF